MSAEAGGAPGLAGDPRMRGFKARASVGEVTAWIEAQLRALGPEEIGLSAAAGRVLAAAIVASEPSPPYDRAAMDGYAIRGEESQGATDYTPSEFRRVGRSRPGRACDVAVGPFEAVEIATGAPLPRGADTVIPVESTRVDGDRVTVTAAVPPGRHISRRGEDIAPGAVVLPAGRCLRPQDLGVLSAAGAGRVEVIKRPRVIVVTTGDELMVAGERPLDFHIPDMNSVMVAALVERDGGTCARVGPIPDRRSTIAEAIRDAQSCADLILVSGGSSAGPDDHVPGIIAELGRLVVHGVAVRPASPTGIGLLRGGDLPVVLLPGNPVSCLCAYDFFAGPIVRRLGGRAGRWPYCSAVLPLARKLSSVVGRVDYARVRVLGGMVEPLAISGAAILTSVSRADGFVVVPEELEGYPESALVEVWLYDEPAAVGIATAVDPRQGAPADRHQSIRSAHQTPLG